MDGIHCNKFLLLGLYCNGRLCVIKNMYIDFLFALLLFGTE
jgi:hypothetical protein